MKEKIKKGIKKVKEVNISPKRFFTFVIVLGFIFLAYYLSANFDFSQNLQLDKTLNIPFTDKTIDLKNSSLFFSSIIIGFVDGFNPCAMWVLIYLITLVASLEDKRKMYYIVGTFVATEAIMYFAILAGWLTLFKFIGFSIWIKYAVAGFALWFGILSIYDFIKKGGKITCEVGNLESRRMTMNKIKSIANSPITIASVFGTIILAVGVNSVEFVCSAGLPAVFTELLAVSGVSTLAKYGYILLYDIFFMIDDFIIFGFALFAMNSPVLDKYSGLSKLLGGIIMVLIGILLLFFPNLLM